jgi:hypothetical protein
MLDSRTFFATSSIGVVRARQEAGGSWLVEPVLVGQAVHALAADPNQPNVLYAGTKGNGVLRSDDGGETWTDAGLAGQTIRSLAVSPHEPDTVYAGTRPSRLYHSRDGGRDWEEMAGFRRIRWRWLWLSPEGWPFTAYINSIALSPVDPGVMLAGIEFGAVVRSDDGGRTWSGHRPGALRDCHSMTFHGLRGDWIYEGGGTGGGVAVSSDAGLTWRQPREGLDRHYGWAVAGDPAEPDLVYASLSPSPFKAHSDGNAQAIVFRARGGGPWEPLGGGLPRPSDHMPYALLTIQDAPGEVYAGMSNGDVWHSSDRGDSWRRLPFNLRGIHRTLVVT